MTKSGRRVTFLVVATLANMITTVIIIVVVFLGLSALSGLLRLGQNAGLALIIVSFLAGVILSGFIYNKVLKALRKRPGLEERFGLLK
jgi:hypothetical protein